MWFLVAAVALGLTTVDGQVLGFGSCPDVTTKSNFNVTQYLGLWYEQKKYFAIYEVGATCITAEYKAISSTSVQVINNDINVLGKNSSIKGTAVASSSDPAKLTVTFDSVPFSAPYWILDTDYTNYAVVWSCVDALFLNFKFAWILTRDQFPSTSVMQDAYDVFSINSISTSYLLKTNQNKCS